MGVSKCLTVRSRSAPVNLAWAVVVGGGGHAL